MLLAFVRRKHDASAFERRLARTHLYVTLSYVASLVAGVLSLVLADRGNQIMTVAGISLLFLVWATVLPTQIFFGVAAMICAADRYLARSTPGLRTKH